MKCMIIGAGRLGKNLAMALTSAQLIQDLFICNSSDESSLQAVQSLGFGQPVRLDETLPPVDLIFLTTPDDQLTAIIKTLSLKTPIKPGCLIVHCSGVLASTILSVLKQKQAKIASFHPLKAFKKDALSAKAFQSVDCILEGDQIALQWLQSSFQRLGATIHSIRSERKAGYHAGAVMASNYLVTLAHSATACLHQAGIDKQQAFGMIKRLMEGSLNNLKESSSPKEALTGPICRGDVETVGLHLHAIDNDITRTLYKAAGMATLSYAGLTKEKQEELTQRLSLED